MEKDEFDNVASFAAAEGKRFVVVDGSESGHCCFRFTIVDASKPNVVSESHVYDYATVCECFDWEMAKTVADALNKEY